MDSRLAVPLGVIVARVPLDSPWQTHSWRPHDVVLGEAKLDSGSPVRMDAGLACYFAGHALLELHRGEVESYALNLNQERPALYVVLRPGGPHPEQPPRLHLVTAAPDEAESYLEGDDLTVGSLPMPRPLAALITQFVVAHEDRIAPQRKRPPRRQPGPEQRESTGAEGSA